MSDDNLQLVIIRIDNADYALDSACFQEVQSSPVVTPLPFVPVYIEGLVNIEGRIATQLDPGRLFSGRDTPSAGSRLGLVDTGRSLCALRVQEICAIMPVSAATITAPAAAGADCIRGEFMHEGRKVLLLDNARIGLLVRATDIPAGRAGIQGRAAAVERQAESLQEYLVVAAGGERYGLPIDGIVELVEAPVCVPVPGAPALVDGICQIRNEPYLVARLQRLLGRAAGADQPLPWIVMAEKGELRYGILVEQMAGIEAYRAEAITVIEHPDSAVIGVVENAAGLLTLLLDPQRLLGDQDAVTLENFAPREKVLQSDGEIEYMKCLSVVILGERFAIPLDLVSRIVQYRPLEPISSEKKHLLGVIDVEGRVVPVIDVSPDAANSAVWHEYIVMEYQQTEYAIRVSETHNVIQLPVTNINRTKQHDNRFVTAVAHVDDDIYSLFDSDHLRRIAV